MLTLDQFTYHLPKNRIAHHPLPQRDQSRLLELHRQTGQLHHHHFFDLPHLLNAGDVVVRNNTKVMPARIIGSKTSGGAVEVLLTKRSHQTPEGEVWECLTKPGLKVGQTVVFPSLTKPLLVGRCLALVDFTRLIQFNLSGQDLFAALDAIGLTPIPPYIPAWSAEDEPRLRAVYQTTYAKLIGSAAAPTAGLHFTPELDNALQERGVTIREVTLHVGLGTFLRVKEHDIRRHSMHSEWFSLDTQTAEFLNQVKTQKRPIVAVGTTTTRVLETCVDATGFVTPQTGETNLFVYPPYRFRFVDALVTNFHEPNSTLLMLISAFVSAPNTTHPFTRFSESSVGRAYQVALEEKYRLLSFGDAMLIH